LRQQVAGLTQSSFQSSTLRSRPLTIHSSRTRFAGRLNSGVRHQVRDYSRPPNQRERVVGIIATTFLSALFGSLSLFLASRGVWVAAAVCGALTCGALVMLYRAAFGVRRSLGRRGTYVVAWFFTLTGLCGLAMVLLINGSTTHRLMVLGGSITFFSAGLAGIWSRGHDA
jgi:hypothetical protein